MDSIHIAQNGGKAPLIISEPGLYRLVMKSRKPEAKEFQRWVTHEVLPSILVGDFAKILKSNGIDIGPRRLFAWLREHGWLIKVKGSSWNMPTQKAMDLHLFEVKETTISHSDGHTTINKTPKMTGKGQTYFVKLFLAKPTQEAGA